MITPRYSANTESQPPGTPRLSAASSARKGRWVRHHQMEDTLPKKNVSKNGVKNEPKNSLESTFSRNPVFWFIFDLFLMLFFREKQNEKQNEKQLKNATVNYPNFGPNNTVFFAVFTPSL
jgi:ATP-dependent Zn protease